MAIKNQPNIDIKTQRYDRQLRLWAVSGQTALENAKVCLLHATATGCEVLKNLILPGVGGVTVVDDKVVDQHDLQSNFFLEPGQIGTAKAQAVIDLLRSMNDDVQADYRLDTPHDVIHASPDFFEAYSLILAADLAEEDLVLLSDICAAKEKTLVALSCKGLCGVFRVQAPEHTIIETHPENAQDLRLTQPFPQLIDFVRSFDLDALDQTDHGHVPYVVLLLHYVEQWKKEHGGAAPKSYSERNELKAQIRAGMRTPDEENFEEALSQLWRLGSSNQIPSNVQAIFQHPSCQNINAESSPFWIVARAIFEFVDSEGGGQLPLAGNLPDMKSDTTNYVQLQRVYHGKAQDDLRAVASHVHSLLQASGHDDSYVPMELIENFCKNAAHAKVIQFSTISSEYTRPNTAPISKDSSLAEDENMQFYLVFRAAKAFYAKHQRYPGRKSRSDSDMEADEELLKQCVADLLHVLGLDADASLLAQSIVNYVRFRDREVANMAALMGGLVSQEAIKLITHQYIPINNTCVFNGIKSTSSVFQL
ncbi:ThiF family protein [Gongronella butleri]|nr:ThiF family protein [Gongronella butleri]